MRQTVAALHRVERGRAELLLYTADALVVLLGGTAFLVGLAGESSSATDVVRTQLIPLAWFLGDLVAFFAVAVLLVRSALRRVLRRPILLHAVGFAVFIYIDCVAFDQVSVGAPPVRTLQAWTILLSILMLLATAKAWLRRLQLHASTRSTFCDTDIERSYAMLLTGLLLLGIVAMRS